jgi:hypothetical protein
MKTEDERICLCLNKLWEVIDVKSVRDAFGELMSPESYALNLLYDENEDGTLNTSVIKSVEKVEWRDWLDLPFRTCDFEIRTPTRKIRAPTLLVSPSCDVIPIKRFRLTKKNIRMRDGNICQYSGRLLKEGQGNVDHVIPLGRGGSSTWENMVWSDSEINSKKQNKTPEEAGLKLIRKPAKLHPKPMKELINYCNHIDWQLFIKK